MGRRTVHRFGGDRAGFAELGLPWSTNRIVICLVMDRVIANVDLDIQAKA